MIAIRTLYNHGFTHTISISRMINWKEFAGIMVHYDYLPLPNWRVPTYKRDPMHWAAYPEDSHMIIGFRHMPPQELVAELTLRFK